MHASRLRKSGITLAAIAHQPKRKCRIKQNQTHRRRFLTLGGAALIFIGAVLALPGQAQDRSSPIPRERTIYIAAVEAKGGAHVDQEPFPATATPEGGGYLLKKPDEKGRWEVSSYRWIPGTIVVNQGDRVTLEIVGINGNEHPFTIEGYWLTGMVRRGQLTRLTFTADRAGIFKIICRTHSPSMQADLVVLAGK